MLLGVFIQGCSGSGGGSSGSTIDPDANRTQYRACADSVKMTISPINLNEIIAITPLGYANPPDFTLPATDTTWFTGDPLSPPTIPSTIVTPGSMRIYQVEQVNYANSWRPYTVDYSVRFYLCDQVNGYIEHIGSLDAGFAALVDGFSNATCTVETRATETVTRCKKTVQLDLATGIALGSVSAIASIKVGMNDNRFQNAFINNARYPDRRYATCPIAHFEGAAAEGIYTRVGRPDGSQARSGSPRCGELNQDINNSARGNWVKSGASVALGQEANTLALIDDPFDTSQPMFSIGDIGSVLDRRTLSFLTSDSGTINRAFRDIRADGRIYCFDLSGEPILLQLIDANNLRFEAVVGMACGGISHVFSANMLTFTR